MTENELLTKLRSEAEQVMAINGLVADAIEANPETGTAFVKTTVRVQAHDMLWIVDQLALERQDNERLRALLRNVVERLKNHVHGQDLDRCLSILRDLDDQDEYVKETEGEPQEEPREDY